MQELARLHHLYQVVLCKGAANEGEKHVHSFCEMCSSRCPIEAKVVDGKVRFLSGNPKAGGTATSLCARGGSGLSQLYDENRIKKPLIRAGERGENKWREVSWDEALDYVASKMLDIKQKYGPESFIFTCKSSQTHKLMVNLPQLMARQTAFRTFHAVRSPIKWSASRCMASLS